MRGEGANTVHGVRDDTEVQAASVWSSGRWRWVCWIGVSGVASLTCWGISQPYPVMKMLLLKLCMRSLITLWLGRWVFWAAQVDISAWPPGTSGYHLPLAVNIFSASTDPTCAPGLQRWLSKVAGWPLRAPWAPSPHLHCRSQACPFSALTQVVGVRRVILCVMRRFSPL